MVDATADAATADTATADAAMTNAATADAAMADAATADAAMAEFNVHVTSGRSAVLCTQYNDNIYI